MRTPWGDDAVDDSSYSREDELAVDANGDYVDGCHHGVPFDVDCEGCEIEDEELDDSEDDFDGDAYAYDDVDEGGEE